MQSVLKNISSSYTPVQITGVSTLFNNATFWAISGFNANGTPVYNTNVVYLGVNNSGQLPIAIQTGGCYSATAYPRENRDNLFNYWISGPVGGVFVTYSN